MTDNYSKLDRTDRAILRAMIDAGCEDREISTLDIANRSELSWKGAMAHLKNLRRLGYVKMRLQGKTRIYEKEKKIVRAIPNYLWMLRYKS